MQPAATRGSIRSFPSTRSSARPFDARAGCSIHRTTPSLSPFTRTTFPTFHRHSAKFTFTCIMILRTYHQSPSPIPQFPKRAKQDPMYHKPPSPRKHSQRSPHATQRSTARHAGMTLRRAFIGHDGQHIYRRFEIPSGKNCSFFHVFPFSIITPNDEPTGQKRPLATPPTQNHEILRNHLPTPERLFPPAFSYTPKPPTESSRFRLPPPIYLDAQPPAPKNVHPPPSQPPLHQSTPIIFPPLHLIIVLSPTILPPATPFSHRPLNKPLPRPLNPSANPYPILLLPTHPLLRPRPRSGSLPRAAALRAASVSAADAEAVREGLGVECLGREDYGGVGWGRGLGKGRAKEVGRRGRREWM